MNIVMTRSGDIVMAINNKPVKEMKDLLSEIGYEVGKTLKFQILRKGQGELSITLKSASEQRRF